MARLDLADTLVDIILKMAEGNPGAIGALKCLINETESIDPDCALGYLGPILTLDDLGIYGTCIYVLWSDKCGKDTRKFVMLLRAYQLGFLPQSQLLELANDQMRQVTVDLDELDKQVCERLPAFKKAEQCSNNPSS